MITKENILSKINHYGNEVTVNRKKTKEIIGNFEIISIADLESCQLTEEQKKYIMTKKIKYAKQIESVIDKFKKDKNTRQAVIQFDIYSKLPECICLIQYLIRDNCLYTMMFSRSMDIKNKFEQDIYLAYDIAKIIKSNFKNLKIVYMRLLVGSIHFYTK